jgi:hypothetical protein
MLLRSFALLALASLGLHPQADAQTPAGYAPAVGTQPGVSYERLSSRNNPALSFYGAAPSPAYAAPQPRPLPPPRPVNLAPPGKPFSGVQQTTGVSPYLGLDARETETSLPNYFLFVKPQLDQQRNYQVQQAQYRKLQQQFRTAAAPGVAMNPHGGIPTTGHSAQFMNNGGYYPTITR